MAGITSAGDNFVLFGFFNMLALMAIFSYFYVVTLGYFDSYIFDYNTFFLYDCLMACDASGAKT